MSKNPKSDSDKFAILINPAIKITTTNNNRTHTHTDFNHYLFNLVKGSDNMIRGRRHGNRKWILKNFNTEYIIYSWKQSIYFFLIGKGTRTGKGVETV